MPEEKNELGPKTMDEAQKDLARAEDGISAFASSVIEEHENGKDVNYIAMKLAKSLLLFIKYNRTERERAERYKAYAEMLDLLYTPVDSEHRM